MTNKEAIEIFRSPRYECAREREAKDMAIAALQQIEALKAENERINDFMNTDCAKLLEKLGRVERERDAAIADLELGHLPCGACVSRPLFRDEGKCAQCVHSKWATKAGESNFEWRGLEATNEN